MSKKPIREETVSEGRRLVRRILDRRQTKCTRAGTHIIGHCQACGIRDNTPLPPLPSHSDQMPSLLSSAKDSQHLPKRSGSS